MEDEFGIDVSEVTAVVRDAEVFVIMFPHFERRLLVDTRTSGSEGPLLRVVDRVRNPEERFRELRRLRPRFSAPEKIVAFQWPRTVRALVESGVWKTIEERVRALGVAGGTCVAVLAELEREDRREEMRAVRGDEPYRTLWATE
jgi:hypothetical protein